VRLWLCCDANGRELDRGVGVRTRIQVSSTPAAKCSLPPDPVYPSFRSSTIIIILLLTLPEAAIRSPVQVYHFVLAEPFQCQIPLAAVILSVMFFIVLLLLALFIALFTSFVQAQGSAGAASETPP
jgi:hypothetical protein